MNKATEFKHFLEDQGAVYAGVSESQTYKESHTLSDAKWNWEEGTETSPSEEGNGVRVARGIGAFTNSEQTKTSIIRKGKYTLWHRLDVQGDNNLAVGTAYFPNAQDIDGHTKANEELRGDFNALSNMGYSMVVGGDFNAHTGSNGDKRPTDAAGNMFLSSIEDAGMVLVNTTDKCSGGPTRVQVHRHDIQESTLDYIVCTPDLAQHVEKMQIMENHMGSDHRPLVLTLSGLTPDPPAERESRVVWKKENIVSPDVGGGGNWCWVEASREKFSEWLEHMKVVVQAAETAKLDSTATGNLLDWSFQLALDELAEEELGTRVNKPKDTPPLCAAARAAACHRDICQDILKVVMNDIHATAEARVDARVQFLDASRAVLRVAERKRDIAELKLFRDIESKQKDSKLFWQRFHHLRNSIAVNKSPPPVAVDSEGKTVTERGAVLKAWVNFSAAISSKDLRNTQEEGIYDEDHRREVEERLEWLRNIKIHQSSLDKPFSESEVFCAIRKLRVGSAPGEDGILPDIVKTAADAVNTNKLRPNNTVVTAITYLFNYMFSHEIWPDRWGTGIVTPLHKADSRLDPANYRPITLLSIMSKLFGSVVNARLQTFSEATGTISDEQGGFRPARGTPDQILILREILSSRKERGLPTYATYVDARKAYDTVWREKAYTNVYDSGVRGRLWRQLQQMHGNLTRRIRHPLGLTDPFDVERGVAQGAVESPWLYSNFIDGLAKELKNANLGVWIAGRQVPLLMYADDVIVLANSQLELAQMNKIVSDFAYRNRFQFNGSKSAVMAFNVSRAQKATCEKTPWSLFGEKVKVVPHYTYLGVLVTENEASWKAHVNTAINKAKRRSADLLWICRQDKGIRPRTAATLWNSLVRPLLEYAADLWGGTVTKAQEQSAELVQTTFLKGVLGLHRNGGGVSNHVLRAEIGAEIINARWKKLQLGYWRRIFDSPPGRLLREVVAFRHRERNSNGSYGTRGWLPSVEKTLYTVNLAQYWTHPTEATNMGHATWSKKVYEVVDEWNNKERATALSDQPSTEGYVMVKEWRENPSAYCFSSCEESKLGMLIPERYLDDRSDLKGTRLKLLCRIGCLPVMNRVGREQKPPWEKLTRLCPCCSLGEVEDVAHLILRCSTYTRHRQRLFATMHAAANHPDAFYTKPTRAGKVSTDIPHTESYEKAKALLRSPTQCWQASATILLAVILGQRIGAPNLEDKIDAATKRFLRKAWHARSHWTTAVNKALGTSYDVFTPWNS